MYPVSPEYIEQILSNSVTTNWYGTIRTATGVTYQITPAIIVEGSGKITRQICSGQDIQIGSTCSAELDISLYLDNVNRYELYNGTVKMYFQLLVNGSWETVPLGEFYINEPPERSMNVITIHAYDAMMKFNGEFKTTLIGVPYTLIRYACNACGVPLGTTQEEIANYTNGTVETYNFEEVEIYTWRDFVGFVASYMCCFAYIGVDGKLYLKQYSTTPVRTITEDWRFDYKPQDYEAYYSSISAYFAVTEEYEQIILSRNGLDYDLGTNPLIQFNADDVRKAVLTNIITKLSEVSYTPFKAKTPCDPALMVGDTINFTGNHAVDGKLAAITKQVITICGGMELECTGSDPNLNVMTETEKKITTAAKANNKDGMYYYDYANTSEIYIPDGTYEVVIRFNYTTTKETHIDFHGEIQCQVETSEEYDEATDTYTEKDGVLMVTYFSGGEEVTEYYPVNTFFDGVHLLHLVYTWWASGNIVSTFEVHLRCEGCAVTIDMGEARGYIAGIGLVGDGAWDGAVYVYDDFEPFDFSRMVRTVFDESVGTTFGTPSQAGLDQSAKKRNFFRTMFNGMSGNVTASNLHRFTVLWNENDVATVDTHIDNGVWVNDSIYVSGTITTPNSEVSTILSITSHHSETFGDVTYIVSFDGGTSWYSYSGGWVLHTEGHGMAEPVMRSITQTEWNSMLQGTIMVRAILEGDTQVRDIQIYTEEVTE